jgi:oxaloacetate decarboxylase gamma subunit
MLIEGLRLMVAGMGMVFAFLILMVLLMNASAKFFERFTEPVEEAAPVVVPHKETHQAADAGLETIAVAIAAAKSYSSN